MDAKSMVAGHDVFAFIRVHHFHGTAGELRESYSGGDTIIPGDANGDGKADFSIALTGHMSQPLFAESELFLIGG